MDKDFNMDSFENSSKTAYSVYIGGGKTAKALSIALFAGCLFLGTGINQSTYAQTSPTSTNELNDTFGVLGRTGYIATNSHGSLTGAAAGIFDKQNEDGTVETAGVDTQNNTNLAVPTLDYLHSQGAIIPQTNGYDKTNKVYINGEPLQPNDDDGNPNYGSAYTLTPYTGTIDPENLPENVIAKYQITEVTRYYDKDTGALVENPTEEDITAEKYYAVVEKKQIPQYYTVNLKKTEYQQAGLKDTDTTATIHFNWTKDDKGYSLSMADSASDINSITYEYKMDSVIGEGNVAKYFKWQNDSGKLTLVEVGNASDADITTQYKDTYLTRKNYDYTDAIPQGTFKDLTSTSQGAAIYISLNPQGDLVNDFVNNTGSSGGAVAILSGTINSITGNFIGNNSRSGGGAIYLNSSSGNSIGNIKGNFIGNTATSYGGAISTGGKITKIEGNFIGNQSTKSYGGAIDNYGTITELNSSFIGNSSYDLGGAIFNIRNINSITGDFINNYSNSDGTIYNKGGTIGNINGNFIANNSKSGGAIFNADGTIGDITGDFIGNIARSYGGVIFNTGTNIATIGNITGNFIGNMAQNTGSAIYNSNNGIIGNIVGDFIGNHANEGTIINYGTIGDIVGDFIGNISNYHSAAIYSNTNAYLENITGNFINNRVISNGINYGYAQGGAICFCTLNDSKLHTITGNFIGNYTSGGEGGAIFHQAGTIDSIIGDFLYNHIDCTTNYDASGGGIYNNGGRINRIQGDFIGNYTKTIDHQAFGGALYINSTSNITGDFINNYAERTGTATYYNAKGGAIYTNTPSNHNLFITGNFINNHAKNTTTSAQGGAIYNDYIIRHLEGDFIGNSVYSEKNEAHGGALYNSTTCYDIIGNFINNYAQTNSGSAIGGGLYTGSNFHNLSGDFVGNYTESNSGNSFGGGFANRWDMYNPVTIKFNANYSKSNSGNAAGGAFYNYKSGNVRELSGEFTNNYAQSETGKAYGGAIANQDTTYLEYVNKDGKLALNKPDSRLSVYNYVNVDNENLNNYVYRSNLMTDLNNSNKIITLNPDSISTYKYLVLDDETYANLTEDDKEAYYQQGLCTKITGWGTSYYILSQTDYENTVKNYATSTSYYSLDELADYIDNDVTPSEQIEKRVQLTLKNVQIINNHAKSGTDAKGGAIWTNYDLGIIAERDNTTVIKGNYVQVGDGEKDYQAIWVDRDDATLTLTSRYGGNSKLEVYDNINGAMGYGLHLTGTAGSNINLYDGLYNAKLTADNVFVNFKYSHDKEIKNFDMHSINIENSARVTLELDIDTQNKTADTITAKGGKSTGLITITAVNFINDELHPTSEFVIPVLNLTEDSTLKLAINNGLLDPNEALVRTERLASDTITTDVNWDENFESYTAVTEVYGKLGLAKTTTEDDSIGVNITRVENYNENFATLDNTLKLWASQDATNPDTGEVVDRNFNYNTADDTYKVAVDLGSATEGTMNINGVTEGDKHSTLDLDGHQGIVLDNNTKLNLNDVTLTGNSVLLTVENELAEVNLNNVLLDGNISSSTDYNMQISGNTTLVGNVGFAKATVLDGTTLNLVSNDHFTSANVDVQGGTINLINGVTQYQLANSFKVSGNTTLNLDADLAKSVMDRLPSTTTVVGNAIINVNKINLLSDAKTDKTYIPFAYDNFKKNVQYIGKQDLVFEGGNTIAYAPIYKYGVSYNNENGQFVFTRGDSGVGGNNYEAFNPAVLTTPVAAESGATATQNQVFNYAFQNSDNFMTIPYLERVAKMKANKYALSPTGDATDVGTFSPLFTQNDENSIWVKPYATFENVPLKNGPKVTNNTYGTLVGYDTGLRELKHGWARTFTGYLGYNGASQRYSGVSSTLNGGLIGGTMTLYKKNFFNATTLSTGAIVGENNNMYGHENFTMLMAGIGNKTGYNLEFKEGKFIIQPNVLLSYTFVNTFDYNNAAGVKIESDPLHAIQVAPGVKFIGNFNNGWQPYVGVNMVWNIMGKSHSTANGVNLPEMSIKPYVQYGVGVQKRIKDHFMAYGQAMIQNGGRNGISLTAGFRWAIGHECNIQKVDSTKVKKADKQNTTKTPTLKTQSTQQNGSKSVLKQMSNAQKAILIPRSKNTTRTNNIATIKQL